MRTKITHVEDRYQHFAIETAEQNRANLFDKIVTGRPNAYEYSAALRRVEVAQTMEELMRLTPFREVTWDRIVTESVEAAKEHIERYGIKERRDLDVVCYYNRHDHFEAPAPTPEIENLDCRSFSIVSNSYAMVLFADSSSPAFLQEAVGTRHAGQFD